MFTILKGYISAMKTKIYIKMLFPLSLFGLIFRILEILFAIEPSSGFYYLDSFIPLLCNIYIFLVIAFFISEIFLTKAESKSIRKRLGAIKIADKIFMIASAVFILGSALQNLLVEYQINFSYDSIKDLFSDFKIYILILAVLSCVFIVFFASDPKKYSTSSFMSILSLSLTFYYVLRLFTRFLDMNEILSKAYSTHTILLIGFIVLSLLNFSKILAGLRAKKFFVAFGLCTVFLAVLHLAEFVIYFFPGNPYNIPVDSIFAYIADFLVSLVILRLIIIVSKKQDKTEKNISLSSNERISDNDVSNESDSDNTFIDEKENNEINPPQNDNNNDDQSLNTENI